MRILLLAQFFPPDIGGEERHVFNLANTLAGRGHEVAVATQRMVGVPDLQTLASGVRVHRFSTAAMRLPGVYSTNRAHYLRCRIHWASASCHASPAGAATCCPRTQLGCQQRSGAASLIPDGIALRARTDSARLQPCLCDEEVDADGLGM